MSVACHAIPTVTSYAPGVLAYLDCQAEAIGAHGYAALGVPGAGGAAWLSGLMTLLIAFIGYRLLTGGVIEVRDGVLTAVKVGLVLALATSWPAYQVLVYDVILRAPAALAADVGGGAGLPGAGGGLVARLDGVDQAMTALAILGDGSLPVNAAGQAVQPNVAPAPFIGFDAFALGFARIIYLVAAVAAFAVVRLVAGILLALGPLFCGFLLFDGTIGLFEGWARMLIGAALGALATELVLGVELALFEPWLQQLLATRGAGQDIIGAAPQLLATSCIFALALAAVVIVAFRLAQALTVPRWRLFSGARASAPAAGATSPTLQDLRAGTPRPLITGQPTRAAAVAEAVAASERRERLTGGRTGAPSATVATGAAGRSVPLSGAAPAALSAVPLRIADANRTRRRISRGALVRDRRS